MSATQTFQCHFQRYICRVGFFFLIFQCCGQVFTSGTTDIQFAFFFRIQIQQDVSFDGSGFQAESAIHAGFFVRSNQGYQRTMLQGLVFHDRHNGCHTHTVVGSQCSTFGTYPLAVHVWLNRVVFEIVLYIFVLLRNHIHVCLQDNGLAVFHSRSGRLAVNDVSCFILERFYTYTLAKLQQECLNFLQMSRRTGNLCQRIEVLPHILWSKRKNVTHKSYFLCLLTSGKATKP